MLKKKKKKNPPISVGIETVNLIGLIILVSIEKMQI